MPLDEHLKRRYSGLQQEYNDLSDEIKYLRHSERTGELRPREGFRLQQQIKEAEQKRERVKQELEELDLSWIKPGLSGTPAVEMES